MNYFPLVGSLSIESDPEGSFRSKATSLSIDKILISVKISQRMITIGIEIRPDVGIMSGT